MLVRDHDERDAAVRRHMGKKFFQRFKSAGGGAKADDGKCFESRRRALNRGGDGSRFYRRCLHRVLPLEGLVRLVCYFLVRHNARSRQGFSK